MTITVGAQGVSVVARQYVLCECWCVCFCGNFDCCVLNNNYCLIERELVISGSLFTRLMWKSQSKGSHTLFLRMPLYPWESTGRGNIAQTCNAIPPTSVCFIKQFAGRLTICWTRRLHTIVKCSPPCSGAFGRYIHDCLDCTSSGYVPC